MQEISDVSQKSNMDVLEGNKKAPKKPKIAKVPRVKKILDRRAYHALWRPAHKEAIKGYTIKYWEKKLAHKKQTDCLIEQGNGLLI